MTVHRGVPLAEGRRSAADGGAEIDPAERQLELVALALVPAVGARDDADLRAGDAVVAELVRRAGRAPRGTTRAGPAPRSSSSRRRIVCASSMRRLVAMSPSAENSPGRGRHEHGREAELVEQRPASNGPAPPNATSAYATRVEPALDRDAAERADGVRGRHGDDPLGRPHRFEVEASAMRDRPRAPPRRRRAVNRPASGAGPRIPATTCASVSVASVPPRPYAAGPGSAPALCGPTRSRPARSTSAMLPPPAPAVTMSTDGTRIGWSCDRLRRRGRRDAALHEADVEGGAAHVEGDHTVDAVTSGERDRPRDARRRPREQQAVRLALGALGGHAPAVRLHHEERGVDADRARPAGSIRDVTADQRSQRRR